MHLDMSECNQIHPDMAKCIQITGASRRLQLHQCIVLIILQEESQSDGATSADSGSNAPGYSGGGANQNQSANSRGGSTASHDTDR